MFHARSFVKAAASMTRTAVMVSAAASSRALTTAVRSTNSSSKKAMAATTLALASALLYASSSTSSSSSMEAASLPLAGLPGTNAERTFIAIKPDGVQRGLIAKIVARFEEKGFQLVAMKLIVPTEEMARGHYDDLKNKPFFPSLTKFFSSGPVIAMVWQGKGVILTGRRLLGETDPAKSAPGSIRGDYSVDIGRNIVHGSDSVEGANHEINFWFKANEVFDWSPSQNQHIYERNYRRLSNNW